MSASRRILIVEDEPNVRLVFRTALISNDYILSTAEDGESALRWLRQEPADMVLLDLQMPGMDGMEVLRRLREAGNDVPVVIVSAHDQVPNVVQARQLGAFDFLPKPTTPGELRRVVSGVLARDTDHPDRALTEKGTPTLAPGESENIVRAERCLDRRDFDGAYAALETVALNNARSSEARYLIGVLQELRGQPDAACGASWAALHADPTYRPATIRLNILLQNRRTGLDAPRP